MTLLGSVKVCKYFVTGFETLYTCRLTGAKYNAVVGGNLGYNNTNIDKVVLR